MIYNHPNEYDSLIEDIAKSIKTKRKDSSPEDRDDPPIGGEMPLDKAFLPSDGHRVGDRSSSGTSKEDEAWIEDLENRLCQRIIESIKVDDLTTSLQNKAQTNKVGVVPVIGHSSGDKEPETSAKARQQKIDPYAVAGVAKRELENQRTKDTEESGKDNEIDSSDDAGNQVPPMQAEAL